jgi:phosphoglycolate phosphatase
MSINSARHIKLVIFDLDGTLINAYTAIIKSFNYTMAALGYQPLEDLTIRRAVGWGDENLLKPFVKNSDLQKALLLYRRHHKESLIRYSRVFAHVYRLLGYLKKKGYKLAVASNRPTRFSLILIRHLKLKKYFNYVLCADRLTRGKPHPEILKKVMHKLKVKAYETLYVGDMAIDARAGRRAKVRTIMVATGSSTKKELRAEKPDLIVTTIAGLLKLL